MKEEHFKLGNIPAVLYGNSSDQLYLFVHGQGGKKEEAGVFAEVAGKYGWQVLGIDLPEHGERKNSVESFDPWHVVPELQQVMEYAKKGWNRVALRANSVGSYFSILAYSMESLERCLLVSPLVDMNRMIFNLMKWSGVTEERLEREKIIPTNFGQTLSWEYLTYVKTHPITKWKVPTFILRAEKDEMIDEDVVRAFSERFDCQLTICPVGEHWFHTDEELDTLRQWEEKAIRS